MQTLEVGRCLLSGRGVNSASTYYDKHGCVAFWKSTHVSMDSQVETVPGPQPQRGPPPATGVSDPEHVAGKGQSRATGYNLNICHCNAEGVRTKKFELQTFLKTQHRCLLHSRDSSYSKPSLLCQRL